MSRPKSATFTTSEFRRRRQRWGMSQAELAKYMGCSVTVVKTIESGRRWMPPGMELMFEGLENRLIAEGYELRDSPLDYRVVKRGEQFFRYPKDRQLPQDVTEIEGVHNENGLLHPEYRNLPLVYSFPYFARHGFTARLPVFVKSPLVDKTPLDYPNRKRWSANTPPVDTIVPGE